MNPVHEHRLRRRITDVISREGFSLKRTSPGDPKFKQLGRWSRWDGLNLVETHVDLQDLARRCEAYRNSGIRPRGEDIKPSSVNLVDYSKFVYVLPPEPPKPVKAIIPDPQLSLF